jgi:hypothetical protein
MGGVDVLSLALVGFTPRPIGNWATDVGENKILDPIGTRDRLCGLAVRVPGYTTEVYCVSCEVRTEFIYVM